jgi:hypothetical protein
VLWLARIPRRLRVDEDKEMNVHFMKDWMIEAVDADEG